MLTLISIYLVNIGFNLNTFTIDVLIHYYHYLIMDHKYVHVIVH